MLARKSRSSRRLGQLFTTSKCCWSNCITAEESMWSLLQVIISVIPWELFSITNDIALDYKWRTQAVPLYVLMRVFMHVFMCVFFCLFLGGKSIPECFSTTTNPTADICESISWLKRKHPCPLFSLSLSHTRPSPPYIPSSTHHSN